MKQLTPLDAQFFYMEAPHQPMVIGCLWLCDQSTAPGGMVRHKDVLRFVSTKLSSTSLFRRRLAHAPFRLDDPYWVEDKNFDLEYHIRHVGLPQPGDWRQLCIFTARAMSRSLDMARAPWELTVIEGLSNVDGVPPGSFAVLLRFHHAYVDGKSGAMLTTLLLDDTPDNDELPQTQPFGEHMPSQTQLWAQTLPRLLGHSYRGLTAGVTFAKKSVQLLNQLRSNEEETTQRLAPMTPFNERITSHRTFGGLIWPIADLKRIRRCVKGATINDAIVAIIGGGMRRYLALRDALPEDRSLVSLCPVSVRPANAGRDMGNHVSGMFIKIGTDIEDPRQRLEEVHQRTQRGGVIARDIVQELITSASEMFPAPVRMLQSWLYLQARIISKYPLFNTVISNVPGPMGGNAHYFAGAKLLSSFAIPPIADGSALNHGITSLYDQIKLGVLADREIVPDMDLYIDCIRQSMNEYLALSLLEDSTSVTEEQPRERRTRPARNTSATE